MLISNLNHIFQLYPPKLSIQVSENVNLLIISDFLWKLFTSTIWLCLNILEDKILKRSRGNISKSLKRIRKENKKWRWEKLKRGRRGLRMFFKTFTYIVVYSLIKSIHPLLMNVGKEWDTNPWPLLKQWMFQIFPRCSQIALF